MPLPGPMCAQCWSWLWWDTRSPASSPSAAWSGCGSKAAQRGGGVWAMREGNTLSIGINGFCSQSLCKFFNFSVREVVSCFIWNVMDIVSSWDLTWNLLLLSGKCDFLMCFGLLMSFVAGFRFRILHYQKMFLSCSCSGEAQLSSHWLWKIELLSISVTCLGLMGDQSPQQLKPKLIAKKKKKKKNYSPLTSLNINSSK